MIDYQKSSTHFKTKSGHFANNLTKDPKQRYMLTLIYSDGSVTFPRVQDAGAYVSKVLKNTDARSGPKLVRATAHDSQNPMAGDAVVFTDGFLESKARYEKLASRTAVKEEYPF